MIPDHFDTRERASLHGWLTRRRRDFRWQMLGFLVGLCCVCGASGWVFPAEVDDNRAFSIQVVDAETGRGVPLVELRTTNSLRYVTDSSGFVVVDDGDLLGTRVFFTVSSHGYEFAKDGFGFRGRALDVEPGGDALLEVSRVNIAERLYRVTGSGIYADSLKLGHQPPIERPLLNAQVSGQDSVQAAIYHERLYWFWGDTSRLAYPLGHFGTAGAVSELPANGGLDPSVGVNLNYFTGEDGFSRPMFELGRPGMVWIDALMTLEDDDGQERLICHYSRMKDLGTRLEHGLAVFDDESERFEPVRRFADDERLFPQGHAFRAAEDRDEEYFYFATAYPLIRVRARWDDVLDSARYEGFTPLQAGASLSESDPEFVRDGEGRLVYEWRPDTAVVTPEQERTLMQTGTMAEEEGRLQTIDASDGKTIRLHNGSVHWNGYRERYVMIAARSYGESSFLGEVYYAEADRPEGPWDRAVKVVSHDRYSFYNPAHHRFFDAEEGRLIYFEGTFSHTFSETEDPTPRYDYNQIMYRLDLADERLRAVDGG